MATTTQRGYGHHHQQARKRWAPIVAAGQAVCTRCQKPILPSEPWDLDHTDDRFTYLGPAHRGHNRSAGAIKGNRQRLRVTSRPW